MIIPNFKKDSSNAIVSLDAAMESIRLDGTIPCFLIGSSHKLRSVKLHLPRHAVIFMTVDTYNAIRSRIAGYHLTVCVVETASNDMFTTVHRIACKYEDYVNFSLFYADDEQAAIEKEVKTWMWTRCRIYCTDEPLAMLRDPVVQTYVSPLQFCAVSLDRTYDQLIILTDGRFVLRRAFCQGSRCGDVLDQHFDSSSIIADDASV